MLCISFFFFNSYNLNVHAPNSGYGAGLVLIINFLLCYNERRRSTDTVLQSQSQCQIAFGRSFTAASI